MSKKIHIKELKKLSGVDSDLSSLFEEMMGIKDCDPDIIVPKFISVRNVLKHICKVLGQLSGANSLLTKDFPEFKESFDEINTFIAKLRENVVLQDLEDEKEDRCADMDKTEINLLYKKLKENQFIKQLIALFGKLSDYKDCLADKETLKDNFIGQEPGLSFMIFDFSSFDLKKLWVHAKISDLVKRYVLTVLHLLYKDVHNICRVITSPDVDIDDFTDLLLNSIKELKKQPGLDRCTNAFKRIENSINLLKDKFNEYYRESIASSNPSIIMENFIIDVSNQGKSDPRLTREFRTIMQYIQKAGQQRKQNSDPNLQKLFKLLNHNFSLMEQKNRPEKSLDKDSKKSLDKEKKSND